MCISKHLETHKNNYTNSKPKILGESTQIRRNYRRRKDKIETTSGTQIKNISTNCTIPTSHHITLGVPVAINRSIDNDDARCAFDRYLLGADLKIYTQIAQCREQQVVAAVVLYISCIYMNNTISEHTQTT